MSFELTKLESVSLELADEDRLIFGFGLFLHNSPSRRIYVNTGCGCCRFFVGS